jgi:hypothetical protein
MTLKRPVDSHAPAYGFQFGWDLSRNHHISPHIAQAGRFEEKAFHAFEVSTHGSKIREVDSGVGLGDQMPSYMTEIGGMDDCFAIHDKTPFDAGVFDHQRLISPPIKRGEQHCAGSAFSRTPR